MIYEIIIVFYHILAVCVNQSDNQPRCQWHNLFFLYDAEILRLNKIDCRKNSHLRFDRYTTDSQKYAGVRGTTFQRSGLK